MKNLVIVFCCMSAALVITLLIRDSAIQGEAQSAPKTQNQLENCSLTARMDALEEILALHTHELELQDIRERLQSLEASTLRDRPTQGLSDTPRQPQRSPLDREFRKLKQDVQSLSSKLSSLERMVGPLKQDVSRLKLSMSRVESSVTRIDLRR